MHKSAVLETLRIRLELTNNPQSHQIEVNFYEFAGVAVPRREILSLLVIGSGTEDRGVLRGWRESKSLRSLPLSVFIQLHLDLFRRLDFPLLILLMVRHL